jgi:hypothetical protein
MPLSQPTHAVNGHPLPLVGAKILHRYCVRARRQRLHLHTTGTPRRHTLGGAWRPESTPWSPASTPWSSESTPWSPESTLWSPESTPLVDQTMLPHIRRSPLCWAQTTLEMGRSLYYHQTPPNIHIFYSINYSFTLAVYYYTTHYPYNQLLVSYTTVID